ncbi:MAG: IS1595 family transposase [Pseudomonadota bacterium]
MSPIQVFEDFPKTQKEFDKRFNDEEACYDYLFKLRWPTGYWCPKCGNYAYWKSRRGLFICCRCEHHQSVTAGTILHRTQKPLTLWFKAMWWFTTRKSGINAVTLQSLLGFGSYHTAWSWLQKLRCCTIRQGREKLSGQVEADEFYLGGQHTGKRGRGSENKCAVAIAVERKGKKLGRLRLKVIENCSGEKLLPFVKENVQVSSAVTTDGWPGYSGLEKEKYVHKQVTRCKTDNKDSVLPGVHLVISLLKRLMLGTHQGRFEEKYLQRYLDEYVFRFNRRQTKSVGKRFWRIAQQIAVSSPVAIRQILSGCPPMLAN